MQRKAAAALLILPLLASCAASWQSTARKSLNAGAVVAEQAVASSEVACKQVTQVCIAQRQNPCAALEKCLAVRHYLIQAAVVAQLTALSGYLAVDAADKAKAETAVRELTELVGLIGKALTALR